MNKFTDQNFNMSYNSETNINEFYSSVFSSLVDCDRFCGKLSLESLIDATTGTMNLYENHGKLRLLFAIDNTDQSPVEYIESRFISFLEEADLAASNIQYFLHLISSDLIQIKFLCKGLNSEYLIEENISIAKDARGNRIAFRTSFSEDMTYKSVDVFRSWIDADIERVKLIEKRFTYLWTYKSTKIISLPYELLERLSKLRKPLPETEILVQEQFNNIVIPENLKIRDYQQNAIDAWFENDFKGIFEMATGTGKTFTSICAIVRLLEKLNAKEVSCGLVLIVPYKVLLEQWLSNLALFNMPFLACYEKKQIWMERLRVDIALFNNNKIKNFFVITTNSTFYSHEFQSALKSIKQKYIFCADEIHHLATKAAIPLLPENAEYRLGLSASLIKKYDEENAMQDLFDYFGKGIIYKFSLKRAIDEGFLTPYYYYPVFVEMTVLEREDYGNLSRQIAICLASDDLVDKEKLQNLYLKRARLISSAENKIPVLRSLKKNIENTKYNLFYCGDKIEANERFIEKINKLIASEFKLKTHTFTAQEDKEARANILADFRNGNLDCITAIRCLDEGVDIPELRRAYILSSGTNPKEFIQRRGRILRKAPGKEYAEIYDFFVVPTLDRNLLVRYTNDELVQEARLLDREFERFQEFADLALNKHQAYQQLIGVWKLYKK